MRLEAPHEGFVAFALAATEREIALAWTGGQAEGRSGPAHPLYFGRFRSDLTTIAASDCQGPTSLGAVSLAGPLALAPTPDGWVLAAQARTGIVLLPLDAEGKPLDGRPGSTLAGGLGGLVAQPGGAPMLLVSTSEDGLLAVLLDGRPEQHPVSLPGNGLVGAVFTGDGFLVATSGLLPAGSVSIQAMTVTHLDRDLTLRGRHVVVAEESLFSVCFGWSGHEAVLAYANGSGPRVTRVGRDGTPLAPPSPMLALAAPDHSFAREPASVVGFEGEDALLLLS